MKYRNMGWDYHLDRELRRREVEEERWDLQERIDEVGRLIHDKEQELESAEELKLTRVIELCTAKLKDLEEELQNDNTFVGNNRICVRCMLDIFNSMGI